VDREIPEVGWISLPSFGWGLADLLPLSVFSSSSFFLLFPEVAAAFGGLYEAGRLEGRQLPIMARRTEKIQQYEDSAQMEFT
jgi:hypothetical protein